MSKIKEGKDMSEIKEKKGRRHGKIREGEDMSKIQELI